MRRRISVPLFWILIVLSVIGISRAGWQDWRGELQTAAFVVPFVWFTFWLESRFTGAKKRAARIMIFSALFACVSGAIVTWTLVRIGFQVQSDVLGVEVVAAGAIFVACIAGFVWSLSRLLRRADKLPT